MAESILFDPLLPWTVIGGLAGAALALLALQLWRGLAGWGLRGLAALALLAALANPALQREEREPLTDIVLLVVDESASQRIADRPAQTETAVATIRAEVDALGMELREARVDDAADNRGSLVMMALADLMAEEPRTRIAGAILVTDGRIHDLDLAPDLPAPLHALITGQQSDWDRRLIVRNAPSFAILDEEFVMTLRVQDEGAVPQDLPERAELRISIDGGAAQSFMVPVGRDMELPLTLPHAGHERDPVRPARGTGRDHRPQQRRRGADQRCARPAAGTAGVGPAASGAADMAQPLKSDPAVDLVHFTILRPPDRNDGVPVTELSLIAFPTRELFLETIDEFDLVIFDRYERRGILPMVYLDNVRQYVENGGALLMAAGPEYASAASLYRTPLEAILPGRPPRR